MSDLLIDTLAVLMDRELATPFWREYQHLIVREAPYIPLYYPERLVGVSDRLQGVVMDVRNEFPSIAEWWIPPSRRGATAGSGADSVSRETVPATD